MGKRTRTKADALSREEERFCQHYAVHQNGADAMAHAKPALRKKTPQYRSEQASKWLQKTKIQARLTMLMKRVAKQAEDEFDISARRVLQELAAIAFANADDFYDWGVRHVPKFNRKTGEILIDNEGNQITQPMPFALIKPSSGLTRQQKAAITGAEMSFTREGMPMVAVKMADKIGALKALGTHLKLFNQKIDVEHTGKGGGAIQVKSTTEMKGLDPVAAMKAFEAFRQSLSA